ncbi:MAG: DinB family protein [Acidimicrobiales bacterium]
MDLDAAARDYEASTDALLQQVERVTEANIDNHTLEGWSARQIVHHVADSEAQSYARLRRLLGEPIGSVIQGYDEAAWAQCERLGYQELAIENSLNVFIAVRAASLDIVKRLTPDDLERYGEHSESGRYSVAMWLDIYTRHPREHAAQLVEALDSI